MNYYANFLFILPCILLGANALCQILTISWVFFIFFQFQTFDYLKYLVKFKNTIYYLDYSYDSFIVFYSDCFQKIWKVFHFQSQNFIKTTNTNFFNFSLVCLNKKIKSKQCDFDMKAININIRSVAQQFYLFEWQIDQFWTIIYFSTFILASKTFQSLVQYIDGFYKIIRDFFSRFFRHDSKCGSKTQIFISHIFGCNSATHTLIMPYLKSDLGKLCAYKIYKLKENLHTSFIFFRLIVDFIGQFLFLFHIIDDSV